MKGTIILLPHPPEVIDVAPQILEKMKKTLAEKPEVSEKESLIDRP